MMRGILLKHNETLKGLKRLEQCILGNSEES